MLLTSMSIVRAGVAAVTLLAASSALAEQLLFDQESPGGTLSYDGALGSPLVGTDLVFENITGVGTPSNSGVTLELIDGRLNFTTGGNTAEPAPIYSWAGGGTFVLTADVVEEEDGTDVIAGDDVVLLSGTFTVSGGGSAVFGIVLSNQLVIAGGGVDGKNPELLEYFGLADGVFEFATTAISASDLDIDPATGGFTASVAEADITNTFLIPEPTGIYLLGIALAAFVNFGVRRGRRV
jgi:hypothetical protein